MLSCKISQPRLGLCNELFMMYQAIIEAIDDHYGTILFGRFMPDRYVEKYISLSEILDLDNLNDTVLKKHGITAYTLPLKHFAIIRAEYGYHANKIDVTHIIDKIFRDRNGNIFFSRNNRISELFTDPFVGMPKKLVITYKLNDTEHTVSYNETNGYLDRDISFILNESDFKSPKFIQCGHGLFHKTHIESYRDILPKITFHNKYYDQYNKFKNILEGKTVNVLHLKYDDITFQHYNFVYGRNDDWFKNILRDKYIDIIKNKINPEDTTFILAYNFDNEIVSFMKENNYNIAYGEKNLEGEEINALYDILTAGICNNIFITPCNLKEFNGSSFGLNICMRLNNVKKILFDPDNITADYEIINDY